MAGHSASRKKDPSPRELRAQQFFNATLALPAGAADVAVSTDLEFLKDSTVWFNEPLQVPKGARIVSTAWYDNSSANRSNPDPKVDVTWGHQTWEEMQYTGILLSAAQ